MGRAESAGWQGIGDCWLLRVKERTQCLVRVPTDSAGGQFLSHELLIIMCILKKPTKPYCRNLSLPLFINTKELNAHTHTLSKN